jgi:hypothetical protein
MERMFDEKLRDVAGDATIVAHYTRKDTFLEYIFPRLTLRLGRLSKTNDPRETKDWSFPSVEVETSEDPHAVRLQAIKHLNLLLRDRSYVACGTRNHDGKLDCYLRPRMWAQYGDNHRGVCLLIDVKAFNSELERHIATNDKLYSTAVDYSDTFPFDAPVKLNANPIQRGVEEFLEDEDHKRYFLLHKHPDWQHETEYRWIIIANDDKNDAYYASLTDALLGVVVGVDWPDVYTSLLTERFPCSGGVVLGKMEWIFMDCPSVRYIRGNRGA